MRIDCGPILIVDDDANHRALVVALMERDGYEIREEETGEGAIAAARRERPGCVLLDVQLPGASGYEVCRVLREEYGEWLPIIFITGERTDPSDRVAGLLVGADDYVVKPYDPGELVARVRRAIIRSTVAQELDEGPAGDLFRLTAREQRVLALLARGLSQKEIAAGLFISPKTVATHIQRILGKLDVHSRAQAVAAAHRFGLVAPEAGLAHRGSGALG